MSVEIAQKVGIEIPVSLANNERDRMPENLPFVLLNMEKQPTINVKGNYNESKQLWEDNVAFCKENLILRRTPTLTGTQTQAGRQLDIDRDQD